MNRPFLRNVYPHPAHPEPDWFSLKEIAAWDAELLVGGVRCGYWSAEAFMLTPTGASLLDRFLNYYASLERDLSFTEHDEGELVLYMNQIDWPALGETVAETEIRIVHLHDRFEVRVQEPATSGDFHPNRHLAECRGPDPDVADESLLLN